MSNEICRISGEVLIKSPLLLGFDLASLHPIFKAKKSIILNPNMIFRFQDAKSWREKRLYFLAVINSTDLINWNHFGEPESHTIEFCFHQAVSLASWIDYARHKIADKVAFPRYVVDKENQQMRNIPIWLNTIQDIRNIFLKDYNDELLKKDLNDRAQAIEKEFRKATITGFAFTAPLAKWALETAGCPDGLFEKYYEALKTSIEDAWILDRHLIEEIREFLEEELPVHNPQCLAVRTQARFLHEAAQRAYKNFGVDPELKKTPKPEIEFTILPDIPELSPMEPEPKQGDFPKFFQYLAAKAAWEVEKAKRDRKGGDHEITKF